MNNGEIHKSKDDENENLIYEINNNRNHLSNNQSSPCHDNINNINEITTLFSTQKKILNKNWFQNRTQIYLKDKTQLKE